MYHFIFKYSDGSFYEAHSITRVEYNIASTKITVNSDDILTHKFPLSYPLSLYSENSNVSVSHNNLVIIDIKKEQ